MVDLAVNVDHSNLGRSRLVARPLVIMPSSRHKSVVSNCSCKIVVLNGPPASRSPGRTSGCGSTWNRCQRRAVEPSWLAAAGFGWRQVAHLFLLLLAGLLLTSARSLAGSLIIDDFNYATTNAARVAWSATAGPSVAMATGGEWGADQVMLLTCDFATRNTRCTWDRTVALNLGSYAEFALEVYAPNPGVISSFTLYFRSGAGWYGASAAFSQPGWQTLRFSKGDFISEGTPAGWHQIDGIRLSPWKGAAQNTYLAVRQLRAFTPAVLLVRDPLSSNPEIVQQTIDRHLDWLGGFNISCGVITRAGVEAGLLQGSQLAILPYNEAVSETEMTRLESYVAAGGKLMVYYLLPGRLAPLLGVQVTGWTPGDFAAWKFYDPVISNLPARVVQTSWNITTAVPSGAW